MINIPGRQTEVKVTCSDIIKALDGNPHTGMCKCPAHDDKNPSLHVSDGSNGKVLVKCFAGCSQEQVIEALKARGLWSDGGNGGAHSPRRHTRLKNDNDDNDEIERFRRAFHILRAATRAKARPTEYLRKRGIKIVPGCAGLIPRADSSRLTGRRFPAMVCPIVNERGDLIGAHTTALTLDGKEKIETRNDNARKMYGQVKGGFVRLSEIDPDKPLIIGEGIETTLAAMQLTGLPGVAALSAGNMEAISPPPAASYIIAGDAGPVGEKAANALAQRLALPGRKVRIAVANGKDGYDWNDALLDAGDDNDALADLREALLRARRFRAPERSAVLNAEDFLMLDVPKQTFLLKPWLPTGNTGMIHAQRGGGKTWFALSVAYSVATGRPVLGWEVERRGKVLYVDGELPIGLVQKRLRELGPASRDFYVLSMEHLYRQGAILPDLGTREGQDYFDQVFDEHKPDLVLLDPLTALVRSGVENEGEAWAPIQSWLLKHRFRGRTILLVHHEGKGGKPRGSSKREDVLDVMVQLKERHDLASDSESAFELNFTKARGFYGADKASRVLRLSTASGTVEWNQEGEGKESSKQARVAEMLEQGYAPSAIVEETGLTKGRVSQIKKELLAAGRLAA